MRILAVDTSAVSAGVAIIDENKILSECSTNTGLTHSRTLMPMIESALKNSEIALDSVDFFACSKGPGSFTGIRIGVAAIKGLSDGTGKKCIPVSTLEALAYNLIGRDCLAVSVMDARCNQVYCGIFKVEGEKVQRLTEDEALKIEYLGEKLKAFSGEIVFVGDGAELCYKALGYKKAPINMMYQKGSSVALAALNYLKENEPIDGSLLMPSYLRLPQAERELNNRLNNK